MKIVKHISDFKHNWLKILHNKRISPLAFRLQMVLLTCNAVKYRPKVKDIAKQFNISERNLYYAIKELKSAGYLISYGLKEKCIWHIYDQPTFMTATGDSQEKNNDCKNKTATGDSQEKNNDCKNKTATECRPLLYNDCGAIKSPPPQSPNKEIILPPKPFEEMTKEELDEYLPF